MDDPFRDRCYEQSYKDVLGAMQQLIRINSTDQVKKFIYEYNLYRKRQAIREAFMHSAGTISRGDKALVYRLVCYTVTVIDQTSMLMEELWKT